jgi:hypothetical protein
MGNEIPQAARSSVQGRAMGRCERCNGHGAHWHHRRSRRVRDVHRHCPCNGVWLCRTCHEWAHANPLLARQSGFIVSQHEQEPARVAVETPWGRRLHDCAGGWIVTGE